MSDLTAAQLHAALRLGAGEVAERAAVDLLIVGTPCVLTPDRPDIMRHVLIAGQAAVIDWAGLAADLIWEHIPLSRGERQIVNIAISLTSPHGSIYLGDALTGLDDIAAGAVLGAISSILTGGAR